ncbi:MAG TPA: ComEC/Rec2 family competence protein [Candidatus Paceibacterota bacterium]
MTYWRQILYFIILGFVLGVLIESQLSLGLSLAGLLSVLALFLFLAWYLIFEKREVILALVALVLLASSFGLAWTSARGSVEDRKVRPSAEGRTFLIGTVVDEPDVRETNTRLVVETEAGRVLVFTDHYPEYEYGDVLNIKGELEEPENQTTFEEGDFFDWRAYLAKENIYHQMFRPKIELVGKDGGNFLIGSLLSFKKAFLKNLARVIPEPESSLAGGLIVGAKNSLGEELLNSFRKTGVTHIVVLSGYNLSIVADFLIIVFLLFLPRKYAFVTGALGIILFTLMTGAGPASVRAAIMATIAVMARHSGRPYNAGLALVVAGFAMILWNPKVLVFDVGFQLSFLATLGLVYLAPIFESKLAWIKPKFLQSLAVTTISAQIAVLPWLLYKIGDLSLVALPVNLIVLGLIPAAMLFGFITGALGFIATVLSVPFGWISYLLLWFMINVIEFFAKLPLASVHLSNFPLIIVLLIYSGYIYFLLRNSGLILSPPLLKSG